MSIIVSEKGRGARRLESLVIPEESYLQDYIAANPNTIPIDEIKEDLRLLILAREFPTGIGPIDALGIDQDGNLYIIETKLAKNPDKRRVLAQVLDYGAALWRYHDDPTRFVESLDSSATRVFGLTLSDKIQEFFGDDVQEVQGLLQALKQRLVKGEFRFIVLMDRVDDRLKNLATFVNTNSNFTIYIVKLEFYEFNDYEILIPKLHAAEVIKESPESPPPVWTEQEFFEAVEKKDERHVDSIRKLYELSKENGDQVGFRPKSKAGKAGRMDVTLNNFGPQSLYSVSSTGRLVLNFNRLPDNETSLSLARRFCEAVKHLPGFKESSEFLARREYQGIDFEEWSQSLNGFIDAVRAIGREASEADAL